MRAVRCSAHLGARLFRKNLLHGKLRPSLAIFLAFFFLLHPWSSQVIDFSKYRCRRKLFEDATPRDYDDTLLKESRAYEASSKFVNKIKEADRQWDKPFYTFQGRFGAIHTHTASVVESKKGEEIFVLELGFGAGTNMLVVLQQMRRAHQGGHVWGIELTPGWVEHAKMKFKHPALHFVQGDVTDARNVLRREHAAPHKFDFIFLADVWEHIPSYRLLHLWESISSLLKPEGTLYIHIPNEEKQKEEQRRGGGQFFEEVVRLDDIRKQASCFELILTHVSHEPEYDSYLLKLLG